MKVIASIATIPTRVKSGELRRCIDSLLAQTHPVECVYVALPRSFRRFVPLLDFDLPAWLMEAPYRDKVTILRPDEDPGSIAKYLCVANELPNIQGNPFVFVGDDDQVYHSSLIERMLASYPEDDLKEYEGVLQNHYETVRFGSGGIIHGFVGLLIRASALQYLPKFPRTEKSFCVDDQVMSIYCAAYGIPIAPSGVENLQDIYADLHNNRERGVGAEDSLHMLGNRHEAIIHTLIFYQARFMHGGDVTLNTDHLRNLVFADG